MSRANVLCNIKWKIVQDHVFYLKTKKLHFLTRRKTLHLKAYFSYVSLTTAGYMPVWGCEKFKDVLSISRFFLLLVWMNYLHTIHLISYIYLVQICRMWLLLNCLIFFFMNKICNLKKIIPDKYNAMVPTIKFSHVAFTCAICYQIQFNILQNHTRLFL